MNTAVILSGSNLGDRLENLAKALSLININNISLVRSSHIYETEPWGNTDQPLYLNQVFEIMTTMSAPALMKTLLDIEKEMGRVRRKKWSARIIDLDILYYNHEIINMEGLTIPHPHLHERRFVMEPLAELLPELIHPILRKSNYEILMSLQDDNHVRPFLHSAQGKSH